MKLAIVALAAVAAVCPAQIAYLADSNTDILHTVDLNTGAATTVGSTLPLGTPSGLAHDGTTLFTLDLGGGALASLDTATGAPTTIGTTGLSGWQDIIWDPQTNQFFGVNQNNTLHAIDTAGNATLVGSTTGGLLTALAYDSTGTLWAVDFFGGSLGTLDTNTAVFTILSTTINGIQGMSFDPVTGVLYASSTNTDSLYTVDTATGVATLVGPHGNGVQFGKGFRIESAVPCQVVEYQTNSPPSTLDIDGVLAAPCVRAVTNLPIGAVGTVSFASTNVGFPYDAGVVLAPLIDVSGGAITTGLGQIVNINPGAGATLFLNGGVNLSLIVPFAGNFTLPVSSGFPLTASIQMINVDPVFPEGFLLSQGCELRIP
ncbi:MAG: hypothetical protein CMJ83_02620 [Planctomycetes bacterium]|nr:hypothetical protein [Planctomycetota bacterium]